MPTLDDLADRVERLLLRYEETKRTNALLEQQLTSVVSERDNLRARLGAARGRIDELIDRLPPDPVQSPQNPHSDSVTQDPLRQGSGS
jgi:cell division protein ZapB